MPDNQTYTVRAEIKDVRQAPRKVSIVASLVRDRAVADAIVILEHTPRRAAQAVRKAIQSASANATNNHGLDIKTLKINKISVTTGTRMKRNRAASKGRALPFARKSSHILVEVSGQERVIKKPVKKSTEATDQNKPKEEAK